MLKVSNMQREMVAILENAFDIGYEQTLNELWTCNFSLPLDDPKVEEVQPFYFIDLWDDEKYIGKFKIKPNQTVKNDSTNEIRFHCEHALTTLMDDLLIDYNQTTGLSTRDTLQFILNHQLTKHWILGDVDFTRYFDYKWESENLLTAILSVTEPFNEQYQWTWDTSVYPFVLNLVQADMTVKDEIRYAKNMRGITKDEDPYNLITRIYPRGYGEGVNALGIESVHPEGLPYIQAEQECIDKYGIISYPFIDRRFENADSLYNTAKAILDENKTPKVSYAVDAVDLEPLDEYKGLVNLEVGNVVRIIDPDIGTIEQRIMKRTKNDIKGNPGDLQLEIGHVLDDVATQQREINRKIKNESYAQGSLSVDSQNYNDNCDQNNGAIIRFYLPADVVNVNTMTLTYETTGFRAYSGTTVSGGSTTSAAGGGGTSGPSSRTTSASGGGGTSSNGGGTTVTSSFEKPNFYLYTSIPLPYDYVEDHIHALEVVDELNHAHSVSTPNHSHTMPNHTHRMDHTHQLPDHTHDNPAHSHGVKHEITVLDQLPNTITVKVDGTTVPFDGLNGDEIDIIPYLRKDPSGKISRNRWVEITLTPSGLARINANVIGRYFVQSYIGSQY